MMPAVTPAAGRPVRCSASMKIPAADNTMPARSTKLCTSTGGAPLLWSGAPPVLVHNLVLLAGIVLSAAGIFMLALHLTGRPAAGVTAGIIFAFVPYRFDHYMHMELQWTIWIPWAFWALHRAFET